jgi:hypothetical protein
MTVWQLYPRSLEPEPIIHSVVAVFDSVVNEIDSAGHDLGSNDVLVHLCDGLKREGFSVETGKSKAQKICVPVLFGRNGQPDKTFDADAYSETHRFVLEVEAGRAIVNNQFLKDLFQACMMQNVDTLELQSGTTTRGATTSCLFAASSTRCTRAIDCHCRLRGY